MEENLDAIVGLGGHASMVRFSNLNDTLSKMEENLDVMGFKAKM